MCGELHNRTGILMLKSIRPAHDKALQEADQPVEQGWTSMDDVLNLAQVKAELSYLNRLDQRRETNVESLKRLKEARDALLVRGGEVAGGSISRSS
jgi:molybdate-binding protein